MAVDNTRHMGIFRLHEKSAVLVGLGGIGSFSAFGLAKMGMGRMDMFDKDVIESENTGTQFYGPRYLNYPKAWAMEDYIRLELDTEVSGHDEEITGQPLPPAHVIISALDSIEARKKVWESVLKTERYWYIDARMSAERVIIYAVQTGDVWWYNDMLMRQNDKDIPDLPCTSKATVYTGMMAAGLVCKTVRQIFTGIKPPRMLEYDIVEDRMLAI